jgi:TrkA domain protein
VELPAGSALAGRTIGEAGVRTETGATVIAVQRGRRTFSTPGAAFRVEAGDVLVVAGTTAAQRAFESLVAGDTNRGGERETDGNDGDG